MGRGGYTGGEQQAWLTRDGGRRRCMGMRDANAWWGCLHADCSVGFITMHVIMLPICANRKVSLAV